MRSRMWGVAGVFIFFAASVAQGEILTFAMEGTVDSIQNPTHALDWVHLGDRVVYTFTFDSNAPDEGFAPNRGDYSFLSSNLTVSGLPVASTPRGMVVQHPLDLFMVLSNLQLAGLSNTVSQFVLSDQVESNALLDTTLPKAPFPLPQFALRYFEVSGLGPAIALDPYPRISSFSGPIDRFYAVPEPSAILLLCLSSFLLPRRNPSRP